MNVGDKVEWSRSGAPFGGYMRGRVLSVYDFHGATKCKVVSNGSTYAVLKTDLTLFEAVQKRRKR